MKEGTEIRKKKRKRRKVKKKSEINLMERRD